MSGALVSGATTPLGRLLVARLLAEGRGPVIAAGIEPDDVARGLLPGGATYHQVDLTRPRLVRRLLFGPVRDLGVSAVIHLAIHRDADAAGPAAHRLHVGGTRLMLQLAEHHPTIRRFVLHSSAFVYRLRPGGPSVLREDAALNLAPDAPQWLRDRVEADVTVCSRMGLVPDLRVVVLRCAEILAPDMGSQLHDWLSGRVCLRPLGFDPVLDVLSLEDAVEAFVRALDVEADGVFNVPGADVLPLSRAARLWGRDELPLPGALLGPVYRARRLLGGGHFRYDLNRWRFHFHGVLDGTRAREVLGYAPSHPLRWPAGG